MSKENKLLRKYYLLTDASVKRLKEIEEAEKEFSILDRKMKQLLYRKLPPYSKWQLYNSLLTKYDALRRQMYHKFGEKKVEKKTNEMEIQTDKIQTPAKDTTNPFDDSNAVEYNRLDFMNDFENRDNSRFYNSLETELNGRGELNSLTPNSSRRLTAASVASATKKSAVPMRHHLMAEPSWLHDDSRLADNTIFEEDGDDDDNDVANANNAPRPSTSTAAQGEYVLAPPKRQYSIAGPGKDRTRKNSLSLALDGVVYHVHRDDYEDFKEFAAERRKKSPKTMLYEKEFLKWQKKKDTEFEQRMAQERQFIAKAAEIDTQRKQQKKDDQLAQLVAKRRAEEEERRKEEDRAALFAEQEEVAPKSRNRRSGEHKPSTKGARKQKGKTTVVNAQPSVAKIFVKTKSNTDRDDRAAKRQAQRGDGKRIRWIRIK